MTSAGEIEQQSREALARDSRLVDAGIRVKVDDAGVVHLTGNVRSYDSKAAAEEVIERIKGVTDIVNEIAVSPREGRSDDEVTEEVRAALRRCAWVDESRLSIETVNGVVFLRGTVSTERERLEAEKDARWNAGVLDVVNEIKVLVQSKVSDQEIERDARASLIKNTRIDMTEINLSASNGEVRLTGLVPSYVLRRIAEYVVFTVPGVVNVINDLQVAPPMGRRRSVAA